MDHSNDHNRLWFLGVLDEVLAEPWGPVGFRRGEVEVIDTPAKLVKPRRVQVILTLRGVTWRKVQVELSPDEGHAGESADIFPAPELAGFGLPDATELVGLTMRYQIAQKLHACTDPHRPPDHVNDRARDVIDLVLLRGLAQQTGSPTLAEIREAAIDIFAARAREAEALGRMKRAWPPIVTVHPHWVDDFAKGAESACLGMELGEAVESVNRWIDSINRA